MGAVRFGSARRCGPAGRRARWCGAMLIAAAALCLAPNAQASSGAAQKLVDTYSPIVMLRAQTDICDPAQEQFEPTTVGVFLDNPQTQLDAPDGKLVTKAPTAADVAGLGGRVPPEHPRRSAEPGLQLLQGLQGAQGRRQGPADHLRPHRDGGGPHRVGGPVLVLLLLQPVQRPPRGRLGGDADRLRRAARRARRWRRARRRSRSSSTRAARRAAGTTPKVQKEGTHPVVYPAAGSHATFYRRPSSSRTRRAVPASGATTRPHRSGAWSPSRC